jgi:hypothetical protein
MKMKPIKLTPNNYEKIQAAIDNAEGRASERLITVEDIVEALTTLEQKLNITKKALIGTTVRVDYNTQHFAKAYKYTPHSTHFAAEYRKSGWFITDIYRWSCGGHKFNLTLSDTAKVAIVNNFTHF